MHHFFGLSIPMLAILAWVAVTWIKTNARTQPRSGGRDVDLLAAENDALRGKVGRLEERLSVLERIATEPTTRLSREIESLRQPAN